MEKVIVIMILKRTMTMCNWTYYAGEPRFPHKPLLDQNNNPINDTGGLKGTWVPF